ncbi:MAG: asparagine synthase-related protein [Sedimenticola sp.]
MNAILQGWVTFDGTTIVDETLYDSFKKSTYFSDSNKIAINNNYILSTTNICSDEEGIITSIIGKPIWADDSHNNLSIASNHSEILLKVYKEHGSNFTSYIKGNFSFAIIDAKKNYCIIGVDKFSNYPIYYTTTDSGFIFSSSVTSLKSSSKICEIDSQSLYNYIYFHMVPSPGAIYSGINKIPGGCLLELCDGVIGIDHYWKPKFSFERKFDFHQNKKIFKKILTSSVSDYLENSLKTGAFLSGGLDSSTVAGILSEVSDSRPDAFSIGFSADGYDEMEYARLTAKHFDINLHEYYVTPQDVVEALPNIASYSDEPFGNSSALPAYFCAKIAKDHGIDLLLAGDGGDELFAGNVRYSKQRIFELYTHVPGIFRNNFIEPIISFLPENATLIKKIKSYIKQANIPLPDRLETYNFLHRHDPKEIFSEGFLSIINTEIPLNYQRYFYNVPDDCSTLNRMLFLDWQYTLADNDLRKVNNACKMAGIDVAYPMLHDDLVEFSCNLPDNMKLRGNNLRYFFKEALRGWLPNETINKRKQGFGLPFGVWMKSYKPLQTLAYDCLSDLKSRGIFKSNFIDQVIDMHKNIHAAYYGELVWVLAVLELWLSQNENVADKFNH